MKNSKKGFTPFLILIIVGIVATAGTFYCYVKINQEIAAPTSVNQLVQKNKNISTSTAEAIMFDPSQPIKYTIQAQGRSTFAVITDYYDKEVMDKVNNQLKEYRDTSDCTGEYTTLDMREYIKNNRQYNDFYKKYTDTEIGTMSRLELTQTLGWGSPVKSDVKFASQGIFSVYSTRDYYCPAAYPSTSNNSMTFDMKTGQKVGFHSQFKDFTKDADKIGEIITAYFKDQTVFEGNKPIGCDSLVFLEKEIESDYYISQDGLKVVPYFNHASYACTRDLPIPISKFSPYLKEDSILMRLQGKF